jgi:leader peptidase (prepilin peptidase)/N-methyltransferase
LVPGSVLAGEASALVWALVGAVGYFTVMFILALIARGALGYGDVKLAFFLGMFTGYLGWGHALLAGVGAFLLGGVISLLLLVTRIKGRKDAIPFGPFMTSAAILAVVFGDAFVTWYTGKGV